MIKTITVEQTTSYTPVAEELKRWVDRLNEQNCTIISIIETKVNKIPGHTDQGFIIIYSYDEDGSSKPVMDCGKVLQQIMILRKFVKTHMNDFDSDCDAHKVLKEISDKLNGIINMGGTTL